MTPVFRVRDLAYRYPGHVVALAGVSFDVEPGESVCLLGANGSGKSSLLHLLDGLAVPTGGGIEVWGRPLTTEALRDPTFVRDFRRRTAILFQQPDAQLFCPTVRDEIAFGPLQMGLAEAEVRGRCEDLLSLLDLARLADRPPHLLSGGEKRRVALAAVLATDPEVLLLDEPFGALDPRSQVTLLELLEELAGRGKTIIIATHDLGVAEDLTRRSIVFTEDHRIAADGATDRILADTALLLRVNLVHAHTHRHEGLEHVHPHRHGHRHPDQQGPS